MQAVAVFPKTKEVKVIDHPPPGALGPAEARLRMLDIGVCGTDREIVTFQYGTPPSGCDYLVIGHESLGEVVETGSQVKTLKKGDLVVTMVRRPCDDPNCIACREDRQDFCYTGAYTERGIKGRHGYMTEFVADDEKYMNVIPRELREVGVLVEPLTIAEKALTQVWQVQQRLPWACPAEAGQDRGYCHRALVLGAGPVGLLGAMALANAGFETWVYSRSSDTVARTQLVESFGGRYIPGETTTVDQLPGKIGNIDLVYEAVGASSLAFDVLKLLGTNGVFVFTGVPGRKASIEVDTDLLMRDFVLQNQMVFGTVNADKRAFQNAINDLGTFMTRWPDAVRKLITGRYPIDQAKDLLLGKAEGIKNVVAVS